MTSEGLISYHVWGSMTVRDGGIRVYVNGRVAPSDLAIVDTKENVATIEALLDAAFRAGGRAELRHVRETLGIKE